MEKIEKIKFGLTMLACVIIIFLKSCTVTYKTEKTLEVKKAEKNDSTKID